MFFVGMNLDALSKFLSSTKDTRSWGDKASPHVVIVVVILLIGLEGTGGQKNPGTGNLPGLRLVISCELARIDRVLQPAGRLPGGCSPQACHRCSWCESEEYSGTH
ncbi:hypothetical protein D3C87_1583780 [compost metagenome]